MLSVIGIYIHYCFIQVQYNPGQPRRTGLPQPMTRASHPPSIPEETRPKSSQSSAVTGLSGGDKEK